MAHRVTHAGLVVLHSAPATDARLLHGGLVVLHSAPATDARLVHAGIVVLHGLPPDSLSITGSYVEYATSGTPPSTDRGCGAFARIIFPDPGLCHIELVSSEGGACVGQLVASDSNCGTMIPSLSGLPGDDTVPNALIAVVTAGGESAGSWTYQQGAGTAVIGQDDIGRISHWHEVWIPGLVDPDAWQAGTVAAYVSDTKEVLVVAYDSASDEFLLARRDASVPGVTYAKSRFTLIPTPASATMATFRTSIVEVKPGLLLLAYMYDAPTDGAIPLTRLAIHKSTDAGATWSLVTADATTKGKNLDLALGFRMAVSGSWVRIACRAVAAGGWVFIHSRDGLSWTLVDSALATTASYGNAEDPAPYDLIGVGDGLFLLVYSDDGSGTTWTYAHASNDSDWTDIAVGTGAAFESRPTLATIVSIAGVRAWNRVFVMITTTDGPGQNGDDQVSIYHQEATRVLRHGPGTTASPASGEWLPIEPVPALHGMKHFPSWPTLVDEGGRQLSLYAGVLDENAGVLTWKVGSTIAAALSGLSPRPFGEQEVGPHRGATPAADGVTLKSIYDVFWGVGTQRPAGASDASADTGWVQNTGGVFSVVYRTGQMLTSTIAGQVTFFLSLSSSGADSWMRTGGVLGFQGEYVSGSSIVSLEAGLRLISEVPNPVNGEIDLEIRFDGTTILVHDNKAAATAASITFDTTRRFECRLSFRWETISILTCVLTAYHIDDHESVVSSAVFNPTAAITASTDSIEFGVFSGTADANWYEVWIAKNVNAAIREEESGTLGIWMGSRTVLGPNCTLVSWGGGSAALGDDWAEERCYTYSASRALHQSRLIGWRSGGDTPLSPQELIFVRDPDEPAAKFAHDCIALFGLEERFVLVDYDDSSSFVTAFGAQTVSTVRHLGMRVVSATGNVITIDLTTYESVVAPAPITGELAGMRFEVMSGALIGLVFKVLTHCDDTITLETSDDVGALVPGDTLDFFATFGTVQYSSRVVARYMRIRFQHPVTATGDHRLSALVPGCCLDVPFQLEWTHTDQAESRVAIFEGEGGIEHAYQLAPDRRVWTGRILNDYQQWRQEVVNLLRVMARFETRALVFLPDASNDASAIYGRFIGAVQDNSFWWDDTHDVDGVNQHPGGDLAIQIREIP